MAEDDERWRILLSEGFLRIIRHIAMPSRSKVVTGGFLLVDRKIVDCVRQMREQNRVTFGLVAWTGFDHDFGHRLFNARLPFQPCLVRSGVYRPPIVVGWTSLMVALTLFSSDTFLILGMMSECLVGIYFESTRRPLYFVSSDTRSIPTSTG